MLVYIQNEKMLNQQLFKPKQYRIFQFISLFRQIGNEKLQNPLFKII